MAERKKGGGLGSLFFKPADDSATPEAQHVTAPATAGKEVKVPLTADVQSDTFVEKFREAIMGKDEIGAKFIQVLYILASDPQDTDYKKAFEVLKRMNPTSVSDIVSSMNRLIDMVKDETSRYLQDGNAKKAALENALNEERRQLDEQEATLKSEISALEESLRQKKAALNASERENQGLTGKYLPKIEEVQFLLKSIQAASDKTRLSLEQTLNEINNHLN